MIFICLSFLKRNTEVNSFIADGTNEFDSNSFLSDVKEITGSDFESLTENMVPKTRQLIELIKKYIHHRYTLKEIIDYLEPFMIYIDDITYKQYQTIVSFISKKLNDYKKDFINKSREYQQLQYRRPKLSEMKYTLFNLLKDQKNPINGEDLQNQVLNSMYKLDTKQRRENYGENVLIPYDTPSEIIHKIYNTDGGVSFNTAIALANLPLITPVDVQAELEQSNQSMVEEIQSEATNNPCSDFVLTKRYLEMDELLSDNGKNYLF